ncbi:MAG: PIN domain-containing protein [Nitrospirota bacterium]
MFINALRILLIIFGSIIGYYTGFGIKAEYDYIGLISGFGISLLIILIEISLRKVSGRILIGGLLGLTGGVLISSIINSSLASILPNKQRFFMQFLLSVLLGYLGVILGIKRAEGFHISDIVRTLRGGSPDENIKILDTSVIIDGRISDICETGFLEGTFILPQFILQELQYIADSSDPLKRARGRRGLDILHKIQKMADLNVKIIEEDFPKIKDVDSKLVALAKVLNAKIITNDFNLNKVAELQGVAVLNINELANAVKPVVLPGETMKVFVLKEGKEVGQGVAYLDDGTMVVVENARRYIGKNVEVAVTSVLQTTAGRMIFTRLKEDAEREEYHMAGAR